LSQLFPMGVRFSIFAVLVLFGPLLFSQDTTPTPKVKSYHDGSIKDIAAIGNREIGCQRSIGNWFSLEKQIAHDQRSSDHGIHQPGRPKPRTLCPSAS